MHEIQIAIVEDHADLRNSLKLILSASPGCTVVGAYHQCENLLAELEEITPQVIFMDIGLPGMSGIEGVRQIKSVLPETHILMLTIYEDDAQVFQAICAGAAGYLLKKSSPIDILQAIEQVMAGGVPMTPSIAQKVLKMFRNFAPRPEHYENLTSREYDVLKALVDGQDYKQIAGRYFISLDTVRNHIRHIYEKLQVHSKSEAVAKALRQHLV
ncbi:response regulator transcription factor [candidate division KSB1 bacterium]|nr:response regulator transcription factor [candidate division KSB1 bacterium]